LPYSAGWSDQGLRSRFVSSVKLVCLLNEALFYVLTVTSTTEGKNVTSYLTNLTTWYSANGNYASRWLNNAYLCL